jgi:ABC-2 type transport system ATP-binding protein
MTDDDIAIKVSNVHKSFKLPHEQQNSIKGRLINFRNRGYEIQEALKDISFEVKKGDFFGIVGRNGSGKSTLLKMLAGIYTPDRGSIEINGHLTPFIELGVGFNPELSGRDNVFLNGALLGFSRKEMSSMYEEIVEFAELERFMDQKLKNYSSGMQVRLAFSIAIRANTDILVLDEVLAVGDASFQQKCFDYFKTLKEANKTIILVTHDMGSVKRFCTKAMLIKDGIVEKIGSPDEVANQYLFENFKNDEDETFDDKINAQLTDKVKELSLHFKSPTELSSNDTLLFDVDYELNEDIEVYMGLSILYQGVSVFEHSSQKLKMKHDKNVKHTVSYSLPLKKIYTAPLSVNVSIFEKSDAQPIGHIVNSRNFYVTNGTGRKNTAGLLDLGGEWMNNGAS